MLGVVPTLLNTMERRGSILHALGLLPEVGCHQISCYQAYNRQKPCQDNMFTMHHQDTVVTYLLRGPIFCRTRRHELHLANHRVRHLSLLNARFRIDLIHHRLISTETDRINIMGL